MLEVIRKGYWEANPETVAQLVREYQASLQKHGNSGAVQIGTAQLEGFMARKLAEKRPEEARRQAARLKSSLNKPRRKWLRRRKNCKNRFLS
jgi:cobalamin biosynthesis Mg chelatase CobN